MINLIKWCQFVCFPFCSWICVYILKIWNNEHSFSECYMLSIPAWLMIDRLCSQMLVISTTHRRSFGVSEFKCLADMSLFLWFYLFSFSLVLPIHRETRLNIYCRPIMCLIVARLLVFPFETDTWIAPFTKRQYFMVWM